MSKNTNPVNTFEGKKAVMEERLDEKAEREQSDKESKADKCRTGNEK